MLARSEAPHTLPGASGSRRLPSCQHRPPSPALCFHNLTNCPPHNSFVLIIIRNARGWRTHLSHPRGWGRPKPRRINTCAKRGEGGAPLRIVNNYHPPIVIPSSARDLLLV